MSFDEWQIELHGHRVYYRMAGSGPPLVLIHGMVNSSRHWEEVALQLADRYTVIAPDLIGHGDSAAPRLAEVVEKGRTGHLVDPEDPAACADALAGLLEDPVRARSMGAAGAQMASERSSPDALARKALEVYELAREHRVAGGRRRLCRSTVAP